MKISLKAGDTGFVTDSRLEIRIPAMNDFKVLSTERVEADDPYIDIYFTEALADVSDNSGLFTLEGVGRSYIQTENAHVKVFYENPDDQPLTLKISGAVSSHDGTRLGEDYSKKFSSTEVRPAVEIPVNGNILPNSKELILPFKAVNLNAVDIRVIQIYEDNVLMFLQDNNFSGDNSLRRCGRLVYKRRVRLDSDPSKNCTNGRTTRWISPDCSGRSQVRFTASESLSSRNIQSMARMTHSRAALLRTRW